MQHCFAAAPHCLGVRGTSWVCGGGQLSAGRQRSAARRFSDRARSRTPHAELRDLGRTSSAGWRSDPGGGAQSPGQSRAIALLIARCSAGVLDHDNKQVQTQATKRARAQFRIAEKNCQKTAGNFGAGGPPPPIDWPRRWGPARPRLLRLRFRARVFAPATPLSRPPAPPTRSQRSLTLPLGAAQPRRVHYPRKCSPSLSTGRCRCCCSRRRLFCLSSSGCTGGWACE